MFTALMCFLHIFPWGKKKKGGGGEGKKKKKKVKVVVRFFFFFLAIHAEILLQILYLSRFPDHP